MSSTFIRPATRLASRATKFQNTPSSLPLRVSKPLALASSSLRHYSSPSNPAWFSAPTNPALNTDEAKNRPGYEEYREEVEPKYAGVDQTYTFEEPKKWSDDDPGHDVQGAGHGRHTKRTLASLSMDGKVCVVTGAGRGLGNMMARTFVESGASAIVLVDLNKADAEAAAKDLTDWFVEHGEAQPGEIQAMGLGCDVSSEQSVKDTFGAIKAKFGRIDTLVTAAGIVENYVAVDYPTEKIRRLMDINVMGTWFCALEASKMMADGGSIVMIGSMSGSVVNVPQAQTPYNFSKAAVRHMARSLAVEWAQNKIRVNCISPGYVLTNLTKVILDENPVLRDEWLHRIPMGRMADPSDLKGAIIYLGSDASQYTTGSELTIDGGYTCI